MPEKNEGYDAKSVYSGMTWPGLIGYMIDKHVLSVTILAAVLVIPASFMFVYAKAQSAKLQSAILGGSLEFLSHLGISCTLGWILTVALVIGVVSMRAVYKKEIHRLSELKNYHLNKLGIQKESSGHSETDLS